MTHVRLNPEWHYQLLPPKDLSVCHVIRRGNWVFVGGQGPLDKEGNVLSPGDLVEQTRITMENIKRLLAEVGATMEDVVQQRTYYVSPGGYEDLMASAEVRWGFYPNPGPVGTGIPVPALAIPGMMIEIDVVAIVGD
jgi:enamine deaminase RidA (YjgF/YER057c/UK114 family)